MASPKSIHHVTDSKEASELRRFSECVIDDWRWLSIDYSRDRGWVIVPVESGNHFLPDEAKLIADAISTLGALDLFGVEVEGRNDREAIVYRVPPTQKCLMEFSDLTANENYLLIPEPKHFLIFCSAWDNYQIAGPRSFVEKALGKSIESAREEFLDFAKGFSTGMPTSERLIYTARRFT